MWHKKLVIFLSFILGLSLLAYFLVYQLKFVPQPLRADAAGYYAYLPAFLIYQDFDFKQFNLYLPDVHIFKSPAIYYLTSTGKYINKYPLGTAFLMAPFFLLAHLVSLLLSLPLTGYSWFYQYFVGLAGVFYLILGLFFLAKVYKRYFSPTIVLLILSSLVFSTNLFHYASFDSLMSHVFSFALISILLYLITKKEKVLDSKRGVLIGIILGLIFLVRNINLIFGLLALPLVKQCFQKRKIRNFFLIIFSFLIVSFPQFCYWHYAADRWLFFSYKGEGFNFLNPQIFKTLFSVRKGLFFWAPIFLLSFLGIKQLKQRSKVLFFPLLVVILLFIYLTSSWHDWAYGASFGHRAFIDLYPLLGLFLGAGLEKLAKRFNFKNVCIFLIFLIVLNLTNMLKYWQRILPYDQVSLEIYLKNLFKFIR